MTGWDLILLSSIRSKSSVMGTTIIDPRFGFGLRKLKAGKSFSCDELVSFVSKRKRKQENLIVMSHPRAVPFTTAEPIGLGIEKVSKPRVRTT
jgi:hypothetical protein